MQTDAIPAALRPPAEAALAWINKTQGQKFELTGLVGADELQFENSEETFELGLVLCDGELCDRQQVRVEPEAEGYRFSLADTAADGIPPLLDPPAGVRSGWLDEQLARYEFVLLLLYRGLW